MLCKTNAMYNYFLNLEILSPFFIGNSMDTHGNYIYLILDLSISNTDKVEINEVI